MFPRPPSSIDNCGSHGERVAYAAQGWVVERPSADTLAICCITEVIFIAARKAYRMVCGRVRNVTMQETRYADSRRQC